MLIIDEFVPYFLTVFYVNFNRISTILSVKCQTQGYILWYLGSSGRLALIHVDNACRASPLSSNIV